MTPKQTQPFTGKGNTFSQGHRWLHTASTSSSLCSRSGWVQPMENTSSGGERGQAIYTSALSSPRVLFFRGSGSQRHHTCSTCTT